MSVHDAIEDYRKAERRRRATWRGVRVIGAVVMLALCGGISLLALAMAH